MTPEEARRRQEIAEELDAHLQARIDYLVAGGATVEQARNEAHRRFGNLDSARHALYTQATRTGRVHSRREQLFQWIDDIRSVGRGLTRSPSFSLGVIAIFTLGLGINAAVFRVAYDLLLRPPAGVSEAASIRRVEALVQGGAAGRATLFSYPDAHALLGSGVFADTATYMPSRQVSTPDGNQISVSEVDGRFFGLLGVQPGAGRAFHADEVRPGAEIPAVILSEHLWRRLFPGVALSLNPTIVLGGRSFTVVGVLPRGFTGIEVEPVDAWLPLGAANRGRGMVNGVIIPWYQSDMLRVLRVIGRAPAGVDDTAVANRLTTVFEGLDQPTGRLSRTADIRPIVPVGDVTQTGASRQLIKRLILVALLVLVIAAANAMNLMLAHSLRRQQEVVVRLALGASRLRVVRLLVVQSLALALAGGVAATVVGHWTAMGLWRAMFPDGRGLPTAIDPLTIAVTLALAIAVGVVAGLPAAWQTTRPDLIGTLRVTRAFGHRRSRVTRTALIVGQTGLSLTLLVLAGLLVLSLLRLGNVRLGFEPAGLVTASIVQTIPPSQTDFAVEHVSRGLPDGSVAYATVPPFGATSVRDITVPGSTFVPESSMDHARYSDVTPNYFHVMGTRVLEGRGFTDGDTSGSEPVAIINVTMKQKYWGAALPAGACILIDTCARVVGVVEDVNDAPGTTAPMRYYLPLTQAFRPASAVVVRVTPNATAQVVRQLRAATPAGRRVTIDVIADRVQRALRPWTTAMTLFVVIGTVGLLLASVGLYSVVSYLARERFPEFGIRMVLGATREDVVRLVFRDGARLVVAGGALGLAGAAVAARYLGTLLFDVSPFEPIIYVVGLLSLTIAAAIAMWAPARRAGQVNPVTALRADG